MEAHWPFEDPKNVGVFTLKKIVGGGQPILLVAHDEDDGAWEFLDGTEPDEREGMIVGLEDIVKIDQSIVELADLPVGWVAWRDGQGEPWRREPKLDVEAEEEE